MLLSGLLPSSLWCHNLLPLPRVFHGLSARTFLLERQGGFPPGGVPIFAIRYCVSAISPRRGPQFCNTLLYFWLGRIRLLPYVLYCASLLLPSRCLGSGFSIPYSILGPGPGHFSIPCSICCVEQQLQYLTAFWDLGSRICNTLQHFKQVENRVVAILQYLTVVPGRRFWAFVIFALQPITLGSFAMCPKTSGSDFAIPYSVSAPSVVDVCHFCNTVHHFCFLACVLEANLQYPTAFL